MFTKISKLVTRADEILSEIGGLILVLIMILITIDIILRAAFSTAIVGTNEISTLLITYVIYFGFAYALTQGSHVMVSLVTSRLPKKVQKGLLSFAYFIGSAFFVIATWQTWVYFWRSFTTGERMFAQISLPWSLGKFAVPVGAFFMCITFIIYFIQSFEAEVGDK